MEEILEIFGNPTFDGENLDVADEDLKSSHDMHELDGDDGSKRFRYSGKTQKKKEKNVDIFKKYVPGKDYIEYLKRSFENKELETFKKCIGIIARFPSHFSIDEFKKVMYDMIINIITSNFDHTNPKDINITFFKYMLAKYTGFVSLHEHIHKINDLFSEENLIEFFGVSLINQKYMLCCIIVNALNRSSINHRYFMCVFPHRIFFLGNLLMYVTFLESTEKNNRIKKMCDDLLNSLEPIQQIEYESNEILRRLTPNELIAEMFYHLLEHEFVVIFEKDEAHNMNIMCNLISHIIDILYERNIIIDVNTLKSSNYHNNPKPYIFEAIVYFPQQIIEKFVKYCDDTNQKCKFNVFCVVSNGIATNVSCFKYIYYLLKEKYNIDIIEDVNEINLSYILMNYKKDICEFIAKYVELAKQNNILIDFWQFWKRKAFMSTIMWLVEEEKYFNLVKLMFEYSANIGCPINVCKESYDSSHGSDDYFDESCILDFFEKSQNQFHWPRGIETRKNIPQNLIDFVIEYNSKYYPDLLSHEKMIKFVS